jgi:hypothetical protein
MKHIILLLLIVGCSTTPKENNTTPKENNTTDVENNITQTEIIQEPLISYPDPTSSDSWRIVFLEDVYYKPLKIYRDIYANQRAVKAIDNDTIWEEEYVELRIGTRMCSELDCAREDQKILIAGYIKASQPVKVIE